MRFHRLTSSPDQQPGVITIDHEKVGPCLVTIIGLNGKVELSQEFKSDDAIIIHLNNLESGLYIVKLQTNDDVLVRKLIVE